MGRFKSLTVTNMSTLEKERIMPRMLKVKIFDSEFNTRILLLILISLLWKDREYPVWMNLMGIGNNEHLILQLESRKVGIYINQIFAINSWIKDGIWRMLRWIALMEIPITNSRSNGNRFLGDLGD